ncbi:MAG: hypothetical protein IIY43_13605 [Oscillospiraceae bacterium]|nr:hypothetical protein [Oscillospiraceae bacterium]
MKNRVRHSAVLFLSMMLTVALLAGISPASSAAPLQLGTFEMDRAVPAIAEKAGELGAVDAAQQAGEEVPLKDRLLKDELLKEAEVSADPDEAAAAAEAETAEAALPEMLTEVELFPEAAEAAEAPAAPVTPANPAAPVAPTAPSAPKVSLDALRRANDPDALIAKYGGFGYDQVIYADVVEDSDMTCYVTDSATYFEYPEVSFDWAGYDWSSFDWDLIEDWDDWAEFGSPDWDGYDRMDGFDYMPQMAVLSIGQNLYQLERYKDGTTAFASSWAAFPDGASEPAAEEAPRRLMFDSPLLELTDVRRASNGLLAVTLQESPFAFEETDPFFSDEAWTFDDEILNAADSWAFPADWAFAAADRGCSGCGCTCGGCGCGCRDGAAVNAGPMNADPVNAGVRWVCYLDPATLEVQLVEAEEVSPDGSILPLYSQTVFYTEPESGLYHDLLEKAAVYEAQAFADPRTVTVVYDPGTERETVVSAACEKGDFLSTTFMAGYLLYEDAEGTVPFLGNSDPDKDVTIYAIYDYGSDSAWYAPDAAPADDGGFDAQPADALPDDALPPEVGGDPEAEGPFEAGPAAVSVEPGSVLIVETEAEDPGVVIVEPDADHPGVVILNPAADTEEDASQEAVILLEEEETLDYAEVSERVYEANKLDAIFGNHGSVQYCLTFDKDQRPDMPCFIYETPDMAYSEDRDAAFYADRAGFYQMWTDGAWSDLYYTFDFVNGFDPHLNAGYQIMPESPEEWWNPAEETPLDVWAEGGSVYLKSAYSEAMSRAFIETWLPGAYAGQTVTVLAAADQQTYELTSLVYTLFDQDGQVVGTPLIYSIDYDLDEPRACRNLRACAERSSELTAELTIIMNPGTDDEVIETMTVPAGSTVIYVSDSGMSLYEDADCTVPASRWDKLSDMTWYLAPDILPEAM